MATSWFGLSSKYWCHFLDDQQASLVTCLVLFFSEGHCALCLHREGRQPQSDFASGLFDTLRKWNFSLENQRLWVSRVGQGDFVSIKVYWPTYNFVSEISKRSSYFQKMNTKLFSNYNKMCNMWELHGYVWCFVYMWLCIQRVDYSFLYVHLIKAKPNLPC